VVGQKIGSLAQEQPKQTMSFERKTMHALRIDAPQIASRQ